MDLVAGALGRLPSKLLELLKDEYKLQTGVKDQIRRLIRELQSMHAPLHKVAQVRPDELDMPVLLWARDVREASYDMEDILDTFLVRVDGSPKEPPDANKVKRLMNNMGNLFSLSKGKACHEIAGAIDVLSKQLEDVAKLRGRYTVDDIVHKPAATTSIDPRLSILYTNVSQLVGIQEQRDKLIKMLTEGDDDVHNKETKMVSVVGLAGLGKTTLAKAVYQSLKNYIPFKAFVPVGQNPDLKKVLKDILIALDKDRYMTGFNFTISDARQLIDELREFLKDKRYFLVIDDVWDVPSWKAISYALDDNSLGSKIVMTTRNHDVAREAGCSYKMEPLPDESSKILFYGRIFGSEEKCPKQLFEVSEKILKKCGGVPLAIITASSLLANKLGNIKEWYELCDSIGSGLGRNNYMNSIRKILSLSYYDLPSHLKTCLLYISIFPEDYLIGKERLIWRWIAEDFVQPEEESQNLFELGESYFNELINRSLIQVTENSLDGTIYSCHVHDMILDLICSLSREESFVTTLSDDIRQSKPYFRSKVRRLSLHNDTWPSMEMSKLRSLTIFSSATINSMPSQLSHCHLLRVLDLQDCNLKDHPSLRFLGNLFHLRYLSLAWTRYAGELPPVEIGKLQFLQTLDISGTAIKELPSSIVGLRQLMRLHVEVSTRLPNMLRNLTSLEDLGGAWVDSACTAEELGHLTQLRILNMNLRCDERVCKALMASLGKLHRIQSLSLFFDGVAADLEGSVESLSNLRYLHIYKTKSIPTWISPTSLILLSYLAITVDQVRREDIQVLGKLQALRYLHVYVYDDIHVLERFMVCPDAFPCVIKCTFHGFTTVPSMFPPGAMRRLEELEFFIQLEDFSGGESTADDLALGHLPSLQSVDVSLYGKRNVSEEVVRKVREKLSHEVDVHPNHPKLSFYLRLPQISTEIAQKATDLVGIDEARKKVIQILTEGNEVSEQQGKIVSIFGFGGLGKTTLANAVYEKLRPQFDCSAFVSVSQTPDIKKLFKSMLYQLGKKNIANVNDDRTLDVRQLIIDLSEFLQNKRYITVIDDIWDISVWKMIRCALPDNNGGYGIITTTRIFDVARQIGGAYMLKPLNSHNSRMLLYTKLFGNEDNDTDEEMEKLFDGILEKCAGIPLAIITIASSLASKEGNKIEWYNTYKSVGSGLQNRVDKENMRMILRHSYYNLPSRLMKCLLYLSIFPEDYDIDKNRLIWLWIAEGFVDCGKQGGSLFEVGENYFHELIDRSMIQLLHRPYATTIEYCRVHDMVLDLIRSLSTEENFVTIWNDIHHTCLSKNVQRLSLQNSKVDHATPPATISMQTVRSVVVFPSALNLLPDLPRFGLLRVLDLQDCCLSQDYSLNLKYLGNLLHLRYLGLRAIGIALLPEEICNLKLLQTLDVSDNEISSLPPTVLQLKELMCLHIGTSTTVPNGIGSLRSLEELSTLCIDNSTDIIEELGHLTELRVLGIECRASWNIHSLEKSLVECLQKLQKIQSLCIWASDVCNLDAWVAPQHLRRLELTGCWSRMPSSALMNPSLLLHLSFLTMEVRILQQKDVEILGRLPALRYLNLEVYHQNLRILGGFIAGPRSFPCLEQCELLGFIGPVLFEQGAMPSLATLRFMFPVRVTRENTNSSCGLDSGLGNLPSLDDVTVIFRSGGAGEGEVEEAKAAVSHAIEIHPNRPTRKIYVVQD